MTDIRKKTALLKSELKGSRGGETVIVIMLTAVMIFANVMLISLSEYIDSAIYFANPNAHNVVKVIGTGESVDLNTVKNDADVEFSFKVTEYSESFGTLYAVSEEFFRSDLFYLSGSNIEKIKEAADGTIPILASSETNLHTGDTGMLSYGGSYRVADMVTGDVKNILSSFSVYNRFAITPDNGQFSSGVPSTEPMLFIKLKSSADVSEFKDRYKDSGFIALAFDPADTVLSQFSSSITISVIGTSVFAVSFLAVIINCYLVFCGKRRYYRTLVTVGGKNKTFLFDSAVIKSAQLLISAAVSTLILLILDLTLNDEFITVQSGLLSAAFAVLVMALAQLMLMLRLKRSSLLNSQKTV